MCVFFYIFTLQEILHKSNRIPQQLINKYIYNSCLQSISTLMYYRLNLDNKNDTRTGFIDRSVDQCNYSGFLQKAQV